MTNTQNRKKENGPQVLFFGSRLEARMALRVRRLLAVNHPHPELLGHALTSVERFMFVGDHQGARLSSLAACRLGMLLEEILTRVKPFAPYRRDIETLLNELEAHWAQEDSASSVKSRIALH